MLNFQILLLQSIFPFSKKHSNTLHTLYTVLVFTVELGFTRLLGRRYVFFKLGFTPCKAEQPIRGMELQDKAAQKD